MFQGQDCANYRHNWRLIVVLIKELFFINTVHASHMFSSDVAFYTFQTCDIARFFSVDFFMKAREVQNLIMEQNVK